MTGGTVSRSWVPTFVTLGLLVAVCASDGSSEAPASGIEINGIVLEIPSDQTPSIDTVERLPDPKGLHALSNAEVTVATTEDGSHRTTTTSSGHFTVRVRSLSGKNSDYIEVRSPGHCGLRVRGLGTGEGLLSFHEGKNFLVIKLIRLERDGPEGTEES